MESRFDIGIDDLWGALIDPAQLTHWYGEVEGELSPGGEFRARITLAGDCTGLVEACDPPQRLLLTMRDPDPQPGQPSQTVIEAQLITEGAQTRLVWEERGIPVNLLPAYGAGTRVTFRTSTEATPVGAALRQTIKACQRTGSCSSGRAPPQGRRSLLAGSCCRGWDVTQMSLRSSLRCFYALVELTFETMAASAVATSEITNGSAPEIV